MRGTRTWLLAAAMALGGLAGAAACTGEATPAEACHAICSCLEVLPGRVAACEQSCVQSNPSQDCLQCVVDNDECPQVEGCLGLCE